MTITAASFADALEYVHNGRSCLVACPAHDDNTPSLSLEPGDVQPVVMKCFAGCETEQILQAAGVTWDDVCGPREERPQAIWTPRGETTSRYVYPYYDEHGVLLYEVLRVNHDDGTKSIVQRSPDPTQRSGYRWNLDGVRRVIYRLPEVLEAAASGKTIHIAEGEKCVEVLQQHLPDGDIATTNSGGAGKWLPEFAQWLAGAKVNIYADMDDPGRAHARQVRESLVAVGCEVTVYEPPAGFMRDNKPIKDIADHLLSGLNASTLLVTTPESAAERVRTGADIVDVVERRYERPDWVIEGLLAQNERLLITGVEGSGKSELLRQFAVCTAAGLHPFAKTQMTPKRVLYIDAENHPSQVIHSWRNLARLTNEWGRPLERGMLTVLEEWDSNINLCSEAGSAWLMERMYAYRPDLLLLGPITNLSDDIATYSAVNALRHTINEARAVSNAAVIMEHHAPLRASGDKERELRPYGNGLFMKWPDFGFALKPVDEKDFTFEWTRFRGDRVRGRGWVGALKNGMPDSKDLPFEETVIDLEQYR